MPAPSLPNLLFRPVRAEDKPRVIEFTARTWEDGDYIAEVFDEWLADPSGRFTAVELDTADAALRGQVVAIGRLLDQGEGEVWLEGLRVDPAHRQQGIGAKLHDYHVDLARQSSARVLRYATGEDNTASKSLAKRSGFRHVGNYWWHDAGSATAFDPPEVLTPADWAMLNMHVRSPLLRSAHRLYQLHWRWRTLSEDRLQAHLAAGEVFGFRQGAGLRAWAIAALDDAGLLVQHLDGLDPESMADMARAMQRVAADRDRPKVALFALEPSPLIGALHDAGYRVDTFTMIIFELRL